MLRNFDSQLPNSETMARKHHRRRQPFEHGEAKRSHLVYGTVGFFSLIAIFAIASLWKQSSDRTTQANVLSDPSEIPASSSFDAIFILGGGAPTAWNDPPVYVKRRCDDALQVSSKRTPLLCLSAGTAHVPQLLSPQGLPVWESTACAAYILDKDPERNVFVETTSYDTIGNAFYARTSHADLAGWKKILIVTNEFHMARTKAIFDWVFRLPPRSHPYDLYYWKSANVGLSDAALQARNEKEAQSLQSVQRLALEYTSLPKLWKFLTHKHSLYTASQLVERAQYEGSGPSDLIKRSYGGA